MRTPTGLPSSRTRTASDFSSSSTAAPTGSPAPTPGKGADMWSSTRSARDARPENKRLHEVPLDDGPGDLGGHDRRLGADDGQLRDGVLAQDVDRLGQRLVGVGVYELGQLPALGAQDVTHGLTGRRLGQEAVRRQPLVVEDLREIAAPAVREQHHDHGVRPGSRGHPHRGHGSHPAGPTDEQALLAGQPTRHREAVPVGDGDDLVAHRAVVGVRPEVLTDALDEIGPPGPARVDRPLGVCADHPDGSAADVLEIAADATDRPARPDAGDEVRHAALGLPPDLGAGRLIVGARVLRVAVLVGLPRPFDLALQAVAHLVVRPGVRGVHRGGADDDLGAVGA